jgi:hypothetical protein
LFYRPQNCQISPTDSQHLQEVKARLRQLPGTYTFDLIPREENKDADRVANDTLDKGM